MNTASLDTYRILTLGLNDQEKTNIEKIASSLGGVVTNVDTEMELLKYAETNHFDICMVGQSDNVPEPSYIIWLLKGITKQSRMIVLYSSLSSEEEKKVLRYEVSNILQRPVKSGEVTKAIESILTHNHDSISLWETILSFIFPSRKAETH